MGGDFRFQGQWLEDATGIYHFRARDYDAVSGQFLSRDLVETLQYQPESFNPYQFAYSNPRIYSDQSGEVTIAEYNASRSLEDVLSSLRLYVNQEAKEYLVARANQVVADAFFSALGKFIPGEIGRSQVFSIETLGYYNPGTAFETLVKEAVCGLFPQGVLDQIYWEATVSTSGFASRSGYRCPKTAGSYAPAGSTKPDFIVTPGHPRANKTDGPRSWLIGDFKLSVKTVVNDYFGSGKQGPGKPNQGIAIFNYAKKNGSFIAGFVTLYSGDKKSKDAYRKILEKEAIERRVIAVISSVQ
jgi:RHS repeat-associated protein